MLKQKCRIEGKSKAKVGKIFPFFSMGDVRSFRPVTAGTVGLQLVFVLSVT